MPRDDVPADQRTQPGSEGRQVVAIVDLGFEAETLGRGAMVTPLSGVVYVDGVSWWNPIQTGTRQHPFDGIPEAVAATPPNGTVVVEPDHYDGIHLLDEPVTLRAVLGPSTLDR